MNFAKDAILMECHLERDRERGSSGRDEFQPRPKAKDFATVNFAFEARTRAPSREAAVMHAARRK